jgi:hypothetical protein
MSSTDIFWFIGDTIGATLGIYEIIGNSVNYFLIASVGFGGLFYWLRLQSKFNLAAKNDPDIRQ